MYLFIYHGSQSEQSKCMYGTSAVSAICVCLFYSMILLLFFLAPLCFPRCNESVHGDGVHARWRLLHHGQLQPVGGLQKIIRRWNGHRHRCHSLHGVHSQVQELKFFLPSISNDQRGTREVGREVLTWSRLWTHTFTFTFCLYLGLIRKLLSMLVYWLLTVFVSEIHVYKMAAEPLM